MVEELFAASMVGVLLLGLLGISLVWAASRTPEPDTQPDTIGKFDAMAKFKEAYVAGRIDLDDYEYAVGQYLSGHQIDGDLHPALRPVCKEFWFDQTPFAFPLGTVRR